MSAVVLPAYVLSLLTRLEAAGFAAYTVGGCVRDMLLGLIPHDYDLCTAALPEETEALFQDHSLVLAGKKHGTIGVVTPEGVVEITTFRTEGEYQDNRHPGWVQFVPSIEEDLARRDFTVNAMAYSPTRGFADPFGGQNDLRDHVLRTVGDPVIRFQEDSLRILRGVRFAVRYQLTSETGTMEAMKTLAPLMENLARERVFGELCKLLPLVSVEELLRFAPILAQAIPELAPMMGFDQHSPHHAYDLFTHTAHVVAAVPPMLPLRWAALLHDIGKVPTFTLDETGRGHFLGHCQVSAKMADDILHRLKAPNALRERVVWLVEHHMLPLEPEKKRLRKQLGRWGQEALEQLLTLQQGDFRSKGVAKLRQNINFDKISIILQEIQEEESCLTVKDLAVNGRDLMDIGFAPGRELGQCLKYLLNQVLEEKVPNQREALLHNSAEYLRQSGFAGKTP